eukprot:TRINITY_DN7747_c0_g1_i1.p1 TRINITY_DN7747_c0_g1~~TRINITY_DN7747_c0_g1_i1.p1  ORF type:complete len:501 (-),score=109.54 TRINITY_DN7747_c0_g1_i1:100-1452(-)
MPAVVPTVLFYRTKILLPKLYHMHSKKEKGTMVHGVVAAGVAVVPGKELHPLASNPMAPKLNEVQEMITEAIYVNGEPCHFEKIYEYVSARWKNMNFKRKDGTPYSNDCRRAILANLRENAYQVSLFKKDKQLPHCWWFRRTIEEIKQRKGEEPTGNKTEKVKEEKKPSEKEKLTRQASTEKPQGKEDKPPKQADRAAHKLNSEKYASPKPLEPYVKSQNPEKTPKPSLPPTTKIPKNAEKLQQKMENTEKSSSGVATKAQGYVANAKGAVTSSGAVATEKPPHVPKGVPGEKTGMKGLSRQPLGAPPSPGQSNGNGGGPTPPRTRVRALSKSTLKIVDLSHIQTVVSHLLSEEKSSTVTELIAKTIQFINNIRSGFKFSSRNLRSQIITVLSKTNQKGQIFKRDPANYLLWRISEDNPWFNATQEEKEAKLGALVGHIMTVKETREVFV